MEQLKSSELIKFIKTEKVLRLDTWGAGIIMGGNGLFLHLEDQVYRGLLWPSLH